MSFEREEGLIAVEDAQAILREGRKSEYFDLQLPDTTANFLYDYFRERTIEAGVLVWVNGVRKERVVLGGDEKLLIQVHDGLYAPGPSNSKYGYRSLWFNYAEIQFLGRTLFSALKEGGSSNCMVDALLQLREAASLAGAGFSRGLSEAVDKLVDNQG